MKFLAPFAFTATVIPRGTRKPRREVLFSTTEFEIPDLSPSDDLTNEAISITAARDNAGEAERVSFAGYDGKLWSPLRVPTYIGGSHKSDVASFLRTCVSTYPACARTDNPLSAGYDDDNYGPRELPRNDGNAMLELHHEDRYDGKILDVSQRTAAIERYRARARDLIRVGDDIYVRRPEPCWETDNPIAPTALYLRARPSWIEAHRFRLDRLDDAQAWIRSSYRGQFPVAGEIHQFDPAFLSRDDVSHFLTGHLRPLIDKAAVYLPYLDASAVMAWHRLTQFKDQIGAHRDAPFPAAIEPTLADLHRLRDALAAARLPGSYLATHESLLRDVVTPLFRRLDFEAARRPRPSLDAADEDALARLSTP
jgi:hypothetical protein